MVAGGRRHGPWAVARDRRRDLLTGYGFLTLAVALVGPVLAFGISELDRSRGPGGLLAWTIISPSSARTILGSIAGSLITIASLTASLTIVALQLLSSQ